MSELSDSMASSTHPVGTLSIPSCQPLPAPARLKQGEASADLDLSFVLRAVRQWRRLATAAGLVLAVLAVGLGLLRFKPTYSPSAWLRIEEVSPFVAFKSDDRLTKLMQTQIELIRSPLVLGPAAVKAGIAPADDPQKQEAAVQSLAQHLEVKALQESELVSIAWEDTDPQQAAAIVNGVVDAYFELRDEEDNDRVNRVVGLLEAERERRLAEVEQLRAEVRRLATAPPGTAPAVAGGNSSANQPLVELDNRLTTAAVEQEVLRARIQSLEQQITQERIEVPEARVEQAIDENAEVLRMKAVLAAKRSRRHEIVDKSTLGEADPYCLQIDAEIRRDEQTLGHLRSELWEAVQAETSRAVLNEYQEQLAAARTELKQHAVVQQVLEQTYEQRLQAVKQLSDEALKLEFRRTELAQAEEVLERITKRIVELATERGAPARVQLLKRATALATSSSLKRYKKVAMLALAAFCLPFAVAVFWERTAGRVHGSQELEQNPGIAVVAEVPHLPNSRRRSRAPGRKNGESGRRLFEEGIEGLKTWMMLSEPLCDVKVLAVTSAAQQEGKTSVAAQLAISLADSSGEPTLLIDGDMRRAGIHHVFGTPLCPGLSEVLTEKCALGEAIVEGCREGVHVLSGGAPLTNPHRLLGNGALHSLLETVRASYRYVVIDTSPVLVASEALILAKAADASLFCAMQDSSRLAQVRAACERLTAAGSRPVGVVLNGVPPRQYSYRYGRRT